MKQIKNLIAAFTLLTLLVQCKKENSSLTFANENFVQQNIHQPSECRLTKISFSGTNYYIAFTYKGELASSWINHYEDNSEERLDLFYSTEDRLSNAKYFVDDVHLFNINYLYNSAGLISEERWSRLDGSLAEIVWNEYNPFGNLIRRHNNRGINCNFTIDASGNATRYVATRNGEPVQQGDYTYNHPNRNPYLQIPGVHYGLPYYVLDFSTYWETSEKITIFENGVPTVYTDTDPASTRMYFDNQANLTKVKTTDRVNNRISITHFQYENCNGNSNQTSQKDDDFSEGEITIPQNVKYRKKMNILNFFNISPN